jgi:hypothetical protein
VGAAHRLGVDGISKKHAGPYDLLDGRPSFVERRSDDLEAASRLSLWVGIT